LLEDVLLKGRANSDDIQAGEKINNDDYPP